LQMQLNMLSNLCRWVINGGGALRYILVRWKYIIHNRISVFINTPLVHWNLLFWTLEWYSKFSFYNWFLLKYYIIKKL
jgi:hypothetical protein